MMNLAALYAIASVLQTFAGLFARNNDGRTQAKEMLTLIDATIDLIKKAPPTLDNQPMLDQLYAIRLSVAAVARERLERAREARPPT